MASDVKATLLRLYNNLIPAVTMTCVMTFFSLYTVLMKKAMHDGSNPLVLALLRECIAVSALLPFAYLSEARKGRDKMKFWPEPEDYGTFFLLGALMIWCVQLLSALSLNHISANSYALLAPSVPVFCLIVALMAGYERFDRASRASWMKLAAIGVTVGGAIFIAVSGFMQSSASKDSVGKNPALGFAYLITNKLAIGAYPNLERKLFSKYSPAVVVSWGYASGAILTFMSTVTCATDPKDWHVSASGWGAVLYSALVSSALNYQLMAWVNRRTSPVTVMAFYPLQSVATPILGWLIMGSVFKAEDAVGGLLICAGLGCLMYARWMEAKGKPADVEAGMASGSGGPGSESDTAGSQGGLASTVELGMAGQDDGYAQQVQGTGGAKAAGSGEVHLALADPTLGMTGRGSGQAAEADPFTVDFSKFSLHSVQQSLSAFPAALGGILAHQHGTSHDGGLAVPSFTGVIGSPHTGHPRAGSAAAAAASGPASPAAGHWMGSPQHGVAVPSPGPGQGAAARPGPDHMDPWTTALEATEETTKEATEAEVTPAK